MRPITLLLVLSALTWGLVSTRDRRLRWAACAAGLTLALRAHASSVLHAVRNPAEWDFLCFWTWGRMAIQGLDFYSPAAGAAFGVGRSLDFQHEILDVGFWYPPQTMLLFAPLGLFSPQVAQAVWLAVQLAAFCASALLAWRMFSPSRDLLSFFAVLGLTLALPGTLATIGFSQTHGFGLLLSLLVWRDRDKPIAGLWVALALTVKPVFAVWLALLAVLRNWRALAVSAAAFASVLGLAAVVFGPDKFVAYVVANPMHRAPVYVYSELVNQSLMATLIRFFGAEQHPATLSVHAAYAVVALGILATCLPVILRLAKRDASLSASLLLVVALVLYPATLTHYSALLLPVLLILLRRGHAFAVGVVAITWAGTLFSMELVFWVHLALLVWLLGVGWARARQRADDRVPGATAAP